MVRTEIRGTRCTQQIPPIPIRPELEFRRILLISAVRAVLLLLAGLIVLTVLAVVLVISLIVILVLRILSHHIITSFRGLPVFCPKFFHVFPVFQKNYLVNHFFL